MYSLKRLLMNAGAESQQAINYTEQKEKLDQINESAV